MTGKDRLDGFIKLPEPDDSIEFFQEVKRQSEKYWQDSAINKKIYGFQIQKKTVWRVGLTEEEIRSFEIALNVLFPKGLKNFYRVMNGLSKPGINVFGNDGTRHTYFPVYYSYPDDIEIIKDRIQWIFDSNDLTPTKIREEAIPGIFPITGHRFLILDGSDQVLSMYGDDIVYWAENISKLVANDIFDNIYNVHDFESDPRNSKPIKFWME